MKSKIKDANILITGANGGIGIESVKLIIKERPANIVLACRTQEKAQKAISELNKSINHKVNLIPIGGFDMNNPKTIASAIENMNQNLVLDIVFLQAGGAVFTDDYQFNTYKGKRIERTIFQNAIGGLLCLQHLESANLISSAARIVFAGGEGARGIKGFIEKPNFKSFAELRNYFEKGSRKYNPLNAIGVSKLVSALISIKLSESADKREFVWFSPGLTSGTNGLKTLKGPRRFIMEKIAFPFFTLIGMAQTPKRSAQKFVECISGRIGQNGDVIGAPEGKAIGRLVDQKPMSSSFTNFKLLQDFQNYLSEELEINMHKSQIIHSY